MFEAPRFADRMPWDQVAGAVREDIERFLGAPIVSAAGRIGGFSPGFAGVLTTSGGATVFVKAISTRQNPVTPTLLRAERDVTGALPRNPLIPALLHSFDAVVDGAEWVALVFQAVHGWPPSLPWNRGDAQLAVAATAALSDSLYPAPISAPPLTQRLHAVRDGWPAAHRNHSPVLTDWTLRELPRLTRLAKSAGRRHGVLAGTTLLHFDIRADNLLIDRTVVPPHVWFVDWPWACTGPAWADVALLALDFAAYGEHRPEAVLQSAGIACPADGLSALLACLAGEWAAALCRPAPPAMAGIRPFQRRFFLACVDWLQRIGLNTAAP